MVDEKINLNDANVDSLATLPGIGDALAERIIAYRETVQPFETVLSLTAVSGISERMVQKFESLVTVETGETAVLSTEVPEEPNATEADLTPPILTTESAIQDEPAEPEPVEPDLVVEQVDETSELVETSDPEDEAQTAVEAPIEAPLLIEADANDKPIEPEPISSPNNLQEQSMSDTDSSIENQNTRQDDTISRRRGCVFIIIGAVAGSILGMALTLALLAALNGGSLQYTQANQRLQLQLEQSQTELERLNATVEAVEGDVSSASSQVDELINEQADFTTSFDAIELDVGAAQSDIDSAQAEIEALEETADDLEEKVDNIEDSAETLDTFLGGLNELLDSILPTPEVTITPTVRITRTPTPTGTAVESTSTATPIPTRTPRPTSTPITLPSSTPEQQP
ncbi:MAG: helix-hairpin-helix domain-containing protein [Chloroflexota bacterium]